MLDDILDESLVLCGERVAVGVSGGADSMLLLTLLFNLKLKKNFELIAIHVNHNLRGQESERDSLFVQSFCKKNKIECVVKNVDVKNFKLEKKQTLEEAARNLRFQAINEVMKSKKINKLFLAHHQNDKAETILMNICRGSGISGAVGIKSKGEIVRPLLNLTKSQILELCKENKIEFVNDSTNFENDCTRNYFRNVVIPCIEKVYPEAVKSICLFGERCDEVQKFIESLIKDDLIRFEDNSVKILDEVFSLPKLLTYQYLKKSFEKLGVFSDIEAKHFKMIEELFSLPVNSTLDFPHKISAKKCHFYVKLYKKTPKNAQNVEFLFNVGETTIPGFGKILVEIVSEFDVNFGDGSFYIDYYKISNDAVWRFRKQGDEFAKLGSGNKKLNDYFTDKKIESDSRDSIPILACGSKVYVVAGFDISENVKIDSQTNKIAKITFIKSNILDK